MLIIDQDESESRPPRPGRDEMFIAQRTRQVLAPLGADISLPTELSFSCDHFYYKHLAPLEPFLLKDVIL
jgi:hypothetical protein